MDLLCVIIF